MTYTDEFFAANTEVGLRSAIIVLPEVILETRASSVIDVGCAGGAWLSVAKAHGCRVKGVDGHVPDDRLLIDPSEFERRELAEGVDCGGFDLAMCLEVAEHLPEETAPTLVAGLCKARWVLFSPAIPSQGGVNHINERWGSWWAELFSEHGYTGTSDLRWRHWDDRRIENFYRQNMLLFATPDDLADAGFREGVIDVVHPERLNIW
jgi:hypothetical protein